MKNRESIIIFLKGLFMGVADIIPGISGGTIALITGIYERLIHSISDIDFKFVPYFFRGNFSDARKNIRAIDFPLFIPLILGIIVAFLIMSNVIGFLLQEMTALTYAFFFGLILASAGVIFKHVDRISAKNITPAIIGFCFAFLFIGAGVLQAEHTLVTIFISGMIAVCAMLLPGVSGAFILLFLNQYEYMLNALRNLHVVEIITFIIGALIGLVLFSRVLRYAMDRHKSLTMSFLIGIMLGALRLPYQNITINTTNMLLPILSGIMGFIIVLGLEIKTRE